MGMGWGGGGVKVVNIKSLWGPELLVLTSTPAQTDQQIDIKQLTDLTVVFFFLFLLIFMIWCKSPDWGCPSSSKQPRFLAFFVTSLHPMLPNVDSLFLPSFEKFNSNWIKYFKREKKQWNFAARLSSANQIDRPFSGTEITAIQE